MGVIPVVIQSDSEFCNLAFEELCTSLGSTHLFSTALHPQSQGIVERTHRELRAALAKLVEAYIRANPRKWLKYIRCLEYKPRHREVVDGISPYRLVHGFSGSSERPTAMGAINEIPQYL